MDVADIAHMLGNQINSLVPKLLPAARRDGHEWRVGSLAGEAGRSLCIHASGVRAGVWSDFSASNLCGDALDLVAQVLFAGDKGQAVAWAKSWLGIDDQDPNRLKQLRAQVKVEMKSAQASMERDIEQRRKVARAIWLKGEAKLAGTPVYNYLFGRGIDLAQLSKEPGALRYHPSLDYPASMNDGRREAYPAMVAAVVDRDGSHVATHRTFLKDYGLALVKKAPVRDAKLCLGSFRGGVIPISRGFSSRALKEAPAGDKLILCEGIEDGLSIALLCPEYRVLAAISVNNLANLDWLPPNISDITIAADNDAPDSKAALAVQAAVDLFIDQGRDVRLAHSPKGKDFNDVLSTLRRGQASG